MHASLEKLEDLSAAPEELDRACREARDFASHLGKNDQVFDVQIIGPLLIRVQLNPSSPSSVERV